MSTHLVAVSGRPGEVLIEERPVPLAADGEVVVEVAYCGVCGSDLHLMMEGWGGPGSVHGHEFSGTIAALGAGVDGWAVGEAVVGGPTMSCGVCDACRSANPSQCSRRGHLEVEAREGAFAGFVRVDASTLLRIPAGLSLREAALAEPLAVALHAISRGAVREGDSVMVFGAGPIGALTVAALTSRGIGPITVVEPAPLRAQLARDVGAARVVHPDELVAFGMHQPDHVAPDAVSVVIECSGKRAAMEAGVQQLRRGGRMVIAGAGIDAPRFDPNRIVLNELTICGAFNYDERGFDAALELLASATLPTGALIEPAAVPLSGLRDAMDGLLHGRIAGKVLVAPRQEAS